MKKRYMTLAAVCCFALAAQAQPQTVTATKVGDRIDVSIEKKSQNNRTIRTFLTSYRFNANEKLPFFFPVNGPLTGSGVTSIRNAQFPHHSSLWFGCDKVNGGNYWQDTNEKGQILSIEGARIVEEKGERVVIEDACIWKRPDAPSPITDRRRITISSPSASLYVIDFDIEMEALMDVTILRTNHSLFSARIDPDLSVDEGGVMVNSEGDQGHDGTFGKAASWIDCYGERKAGKEGLAILQHPSNKWYPSPWFTRDYGFISPTPMWWPENEKTTELKKGEVVKLRYRVLIHAGDTQQAGIAAAFEQYAKE